MIKLNQDGAVSGKTVSLVVSIILLIFALIFGIWAYSSRQTYKNNADGLISAAVTKAIANEDQKDKTYYETQAKLPLTSYQGPSTSGSVNVVYPKTWSAYVDDTGTSNPLDGYFNPGSVPSISSQNSTFALRVQVLGQSYSQTIQNYASQIQQGQVTSTAYSLPKMPSVVGVELSGLLVSGSATNETMVVLPLRSDTLVIWTQGTQFLTDFNQNILPNFTFSP
jgi:hypothetical protein